MDKYQNDDSIVRSAAIITNLVRLGNVDSIDKTQTTSKLASGDRQTAIGFARARDRCISLPVSLMLRDRRWNRASDYLVYGQIIT